MDADKHNLRLRNNDDFMLTVNVGYNIANASVRFVVKSFVLVDWSSFITLSSTPDEFIIYVKASEITKVGAGTYPYDCVVDFGGGSKVFVLGGSITIVEGIA